MDRLVLLVQDYPGLQYLLRVLLEPEGYTLLVAESEQEALAQLTTQRPALIVLDWPLEDKGRLAFLDELCRRGLHPGIPVLVLTGEEWRIAEFLKDIGVDGCLPKPFRVSALLGEVSRLVSGNPQ